MKEPDDNSQPGDTPLGGGTPSLTPGERRSDCFPLEVWVAASNGTLPEAEIDSVLRHAGGCSDCSQLLRSVTPHFEDDASPDEQAFLDKLSTSSEEGQDRLASILASQSTMEPATNPAQAPRKLSSFAQIASIFSANRWAWASGVALACIILVVATVSVLRLERNSSTPILTGNNGGAPAQTAPVRAPAAERPNLDSPPLLIASLTLAPGLTRGSDNSAQLILKPQTESAQITLLFVDRPPSLLHVVLRNATQKQLWETDVRLTANDIKERKTSVDIPTALLVADDYRVFTTEQTSSGKEDVTSYTFRVVR